MLAAAGTLLAVMLGMTGAAASPLMPLFALWVYLAASHLRSGVAAPLIFGLVLLLAILDPAPGAVPSAGGMLPLAAAAGGGLLVAWVSPRLRATAFARAKAAGERSAPLDRASSTQSATLRRRTVEAGLEWVRRATGAQRAVLWRIAADQPGAEVVLAAGGPLPNIEQTSGPGPLGWVAREGIPIRLDPIPAWAPRGAGVIAVRVDQRADLAELATLEFEPGAALPDASDIQPIVQPLGALLALQAAESAAEADRRRVDLVLDTLARIPMELEPSRLARVLLDGALRLTEGTGAALARWRNERGQVLGVVGDDGGPAPGAEFGARESELALAARAGVTIVRGTGERQPNLPVAASGEAWRRTPVAVAAMPLRTLEGTTGVLAVWHNAKSIDPRGIELLERIAPFAALQLENADEYGRVRDSAERDPLTGLLNRRAFDRRLADETARFDRYRHPVGLLLIDVDHFKRINDAWGHDAGDLVLRSVAATIAANVRDVDHAVRFGGEEFAILLPAATLAAATDAAERLRAAIERVDAAAGGTRIDVTASIGVAACPENTHDPLALVRIADAALYEAKETGRNRVCRARPTRAIQRGRLR